MSIRHSTVSRDGSAAASGITAPRTKGSQVGVEDRWRRKERSTNRWQHRLKREHPTCTERSNRSQRVRMEGWRHGSEKKRSSKQKHKNRLDTDRPSHGRRLNPHFQEGEFCRLYTLPRPSFDP